MRNDTPLRIALRNVQRTLTCTQAFAIARAAVRANLAQASKPHAMEGHEALQIAQDVLRRALLAVGNRTEAVRLGLLIAKALESIPESELPTRKQFERLERLTRARARKA